MRKKKKKETVMTYWAPNQIFVADPPVHMCGDSHTVPNHGSHSPADTDALSECPEQFGQVLQKKKKKKPKPK